MELPAQTVQKNGFTLVELLIVVGIITLISGFAIPNFNTYISNQNIRQAQDQVITDLRAIQNRALTGVEFETDPNLTTHWGVRFIDNATRYHYEVIDNTQSMDSATCGALDSKKSKVLAGGSAVYVGTSPSCVFFSYDNGNAYLVGASTIYVGDGSDCLSISLSDAGYVSGGDDFVACP